MGSLEASTGAILRRLFMASGVLLTLSVSLPARAEPSPSPSAPPSVTADDRKQAAKDFAQGDRAFAQGDFREAAQAYARAYHRAPHHDVLWNEARAWHRAGDLAAAANAYARYLREAPSGARDRGSAQRALADLSAKLGQLEIHADGPGAVTVDGDPVDASRAYVTPGAHVVEGRAADGTAVRQKLDVRAGDDVSVALVAPAADPGTAVAPSPTTTSPTTRDSETPSTLRTWSPWVVVAFGAATLGLAGVTTWSGLDTLAQKDTFEQNPTKQDALASGQQKEVRTNILLGVTGGVGLLTAVTALFFVDWHRHGAASGAEVTEAKPSARLGVGIGSLSLQGAF